MAPVPSFSVMHITTVPMTLPFFRDQMAWMQQRGVRFEVVSSPEPDLDRFAAECGVLAHGVPMARRPAPVADVRALIGLVRLLRDRAPDIVHAHTPKAGLLGSLASRMVGVRGRVFSVHGLPQMTIRGPMRHVLDAATRLTCRCVHLVCCVSPSMRRHLVTHRLCRAGKAVVLGQGSVNGVDAEGRFNPGRSPAPAVAALRASYGIPVDALVIGFVGRIVGDKGIAELTEAWRAVRREFAGAHLLMVGVFEPDDPLRPADEALLRSDPRVHLAGWRRDIPEHLAATDLLVNPSHREGFGIAHLEASAMGLPVLATRIPGSVDSVVDGVTGLLVPSRDARALAAALRRYLADPALRAAHGAAGRRRVLAEFRPADLSAALLERYRRLLGLRGPRSVAADGGARTPRRSTP